MQLWVCTDHLRNLTLMSDCHIDRNIVRREVWREGRLPAASGSNIEREKNKNGRKWIRGEVERLWQHEAVISGRAPWELWRWRVLRSKSRNRCRHLFLGNTRASSPLPQTCLEGRLFAGPTLPPHDKAFCAGCDMEPPRHKTGFLKHRRRDLLHKWRPQKYGPWPGHALVQPSAKMRAGWRGTCFG